MRLSEAFEITRWDQATYDDSDGLELGRATVAKAFAGELAGTSSAELLLVGTSAGPAAYTAVERFTGTLAERDGTFIIVHGAAADESTSTGRIVAATGGLTGLTGTVAFEHDEEGPRISLDYELPESPDAAATD